MVDRKQISEHYRGHEVDFNTAVDRFEIMQDGAKDSAHQESDDDTEVKLGSKTPPEHINDPYCSC